MSRQLSFIFDYGVTREQACIMCHLSSECEGCCLKCTKDNGCHGQLCSQPYRDHEGQRWNAWIYLASRTQALRAEEISQVLKEQID